MEELNNGTLVKILSKDLWEGYLISIPWLKMVRASVKTVCVTSKRSGTQGGISWRGSCIGKIGKRIH